MGAAILRSGGVITRTNTANGTADNTYFAFAFGLEPGAHSATLSIDAMTAGSVKLYFSNDTLTDATGTAGLDENTATAAQFNDLTWVDRTARFSSGGTATITGTQVIDFDTNISYRFMKVENTPTNATNALTLRFSRI